jgi:hypothetical protein
MAGAPARRDLRPLAERGGPRPVDSECVRRRIDAENVHQSRNQTTTTIVARQYDVLVAGRSYYLVVRISQAGLPCCIWVFEVLWLFRDILVLGESVSSLALRAD